LGSSTKMLEVVILAVVVILLATVLVLYKRSSRPAKATAGHAAGAQSAASYYSDVGTLPAPGSMGGGGFGAPQSDPFGGFGGGMEQNRYAPAPPPPPPAPAPPAMPAPGTPASWMPDPGGAPDTLRYWDGNSWTQHVAKRN
jgi:Protein of unknown function (DUF2510)